MVIRLGDIIVKYVEGRKKMVLLSGVESRVL